MELARAEGVEPVIMLDDVFAELDARRREHLAGFTAGAEQLLVTAAVPEDLPSGVRGRRLSVEMVADTTDGSQIFESADGSKADDSAPARRSIVSDDSRMTDDD